jgi:hypothetical protein
METFEDARKTIYNELTSEDIEVRAEYLKRFGPQVEKFSDAMAHAFVNWRSLDADVKGDDRRAYVSALTFTPITLHLTSMKLFVSGYAVAAGNLFRQVAESIALALLCSGKDLSVLERFMEGKYSTNDGVRDVIRHADKLGINKESVEALRDAQKFYHRYSHPSELTIGTTMSFSRKGAYVGAAFDEAKIDSYANEVNVRLNLAEVFSNFVHGVKANVAKW